jgi:hypothetical protein
MSKLRVIEKSTNPYSWANWWTGLMVLIALDPDVRNGVMIVIDPEMMSAESERSAIDAAVMMSEMCADAAYEDATTAPADHEYGRVWNRVELSANTRDTPIYPAPVDLSMHVREFISKHKPHDAKGPSRVELKKRPQHNKPLIPGTIVVVNEQNHYEVSDEAQLSNQDYRLLRKIFHGCKTPYFENPRLQKRILAETQHIRIES